MQHIKLKQIHVESSFLYNDAPWLHALIILCHTLYGLQLHEADSEFLHWQKNHYLPGVWVITEVPGDQHRWLAGG